MQIKNRKSIRSCHGCHRNIQVVPRWPCGLTVDSEPPATRSSCGWAKWAVSSLPERLFYELLFLFSQELTCHSETALSPGTSQQNQHTYIFLRWEEKGRWILSLKTRISGCFSFKDDRLNSQALGQAECLGNKSSFLPLSLHYKLQLRKVLSVLFKVPLRPMAHRTEQKRPPDTSPTNRGAVVFWRLFLHVDYCSDQGDFKSPRAFLWNVCICLSKFMPRGNQQQK